MDKENRIRVESFCLFYEVEPAFIHTLQESGMVNITHVLEDEFILVDDIKQLEKFMRLHRDLDINVDGIQAIDYLLHKIADLQEEIRGLKNRLKIYE
jgi:chaperone modulatory protein CbpM